MQALGEGDNLPVELSLGDEVNGLTYTLNTTNRELRTSDGRIVRLDEQLTVATASAFATTPGFDATAQDMQTILTNYCDPADPAHPCDQVRAFETPRAVDRESPRAGPRGRPGVRARTALIRRRDHARGRPEPREGGRGRKGAQVRSDDEKFAAKNPLAPVVAVSITQNGFRCSDIAHDYVTLALAYQERRSQFIRRLIENAVGAVVSADVEAGARLLTDIAERGGSGLQMSILASFYYGQGCTSQRPRIGTIIMGGPYFGGYSGWVMRCQDENWEISFDGGQSWHPIVVEVCWFQRDE